ncbi:MAG: acyl-CoA thioesterase [Myxococcota bacterium]
MSRWDDVTSHVEHRVTFSETDGLGYVHHRCAAVWFEQAREAFFRRFGMSAVELYKRGWYLALRQLNVRYDSFLAYDDHLSIRCALTKLGRVAVDFHYRVDNLTTGKLAVRGHTNMVAVEATAPGALPTLGRIRFDRAPFQKLLVTVDDFFDAPQGAWRPPRWEPDGSELAAGS